MKRIITYLVITFGLTYGYCFLVVYPLVHNADLAQSGAATASIQTLAIAAVMFFPSIGVVLTRLFTKEGFKNAMVKPVEFKRSFKYYLLAWFGPTALAFAGAAIYYLIYPADFDPNMSYYIALTQSQLEALGQPAMSAEAIRSMVSSQLVLMIVAAPAFNIITCFSEEWGWRGYLFPKVNERLSFVPSVLVTGVIWGIWHAPLTAIGHNYGLDYPGFPWLGIAAMCCFCVVVGTILSYVTVKAKSCLPAAIGHGAVNGFAGTGLIFSATGGNPFVGPLMVGFVGGSTLIAAAVIICIAMRKAPKWQPALQAPETSQALPAEPYAGIPVE